MSRILIADDDQNIRENIKKYAKFEGFDVTCAGDGLEAIDALKKQPFDIILMDIMMPNLDGFSAIKEIRKTSDIPVIIVSARCEEFDRIHGFECGCDDYVTKPFSMKELMMRIAAVLRRNGVKMPTAREIFRFDGLTVDFAGRLVTVDGVPVGMSPKEYDLLFFMIKNRGIALSREKLLNDVWGYDFPGDDRTIDTHVKQVRKALGPYGKKISTLRGVGYRFDE